MASMRGPVQDYELKDGVLRCLVEDKAAFYKQDPTRVLALFTANAAEGCGIDDDTYAAAMQAVGGIARLHAKVVREAVQNILLSDAPEKIIPLVAGNALGQYGITGTGQGLEELRDVPCTMETRWWSFLRMCNAHYALVCERLGFSQRFADVLAGLDRLAATTALPQSVPELKRLLCRLPEFDYEAAVRTLMRTDVRWAGQLALYDALCFSGEPYRMRHLAVTAADLAAVGIMGQKATWVLSQLMEAVLKAPEVNTQPALMALAQTLAAEYK